MSERRHYVSLGALCAVVFWGVSFVATRIALESFQPLGLVAARLVLGVLLLAVILAARGGAVLPERGDRGTAALLGLILGAHLLLQAYGLRHTTAIRTGWIIAVIPAAIALGGQVFLRKRLAAVGWLGIAIAAGGVLAVTSVKPADFAGAGFGDLLQLVSCFTWTAYTLLADAPVRRSGSLRVTLLAMGIAALLSSAAALATGPLAGPMSSRALIATAFLGLLCSAVAMVLWAAAVARDGPARTGAMLYLEPFVTILAAVPLLGEPVGANVLAGGAIVLLGVWLVGRGSRSSA